MGSSTKGAKGKDIVNKSKFLWSKNRACFINLEIVCLSLSLLIYLLFILKMNFHMRLFLFLPVS